MSSEHNEIAKELRGLTCAFERYVEQQKTEFQWRQVHANFATKQDLERLGETMAEAIKAFADRVNVKLDTIGTAVDAVGADVTAVGVSVDGIAGDVKGLQDLIEKFNNSPGTLTPEDEALLAAIDTRVDVLASRLDATKGTTGALAEKVKTLDDAIAPVVPVP